MHNAKHSPDIAQATLSCDDLLAAVNALDTPVLIADADHRILAVNPAAVTLTGRPEPELIGSTCCQVLGLTAAASSCPLALLKQDPALQPARVERELLDRFYQITATPIVDRDGKLIRAVIW